MAAYKFFVVLKGLFLCLLGIFFIARPQDAAHAFASYLGILMLVGGLISGFYTRYINRQSGEKTLTYYPAIIAILGGGILLFFSEIAIAVFAISIGLWIFIDGLSQLRISSDVKSYHRTMGNWMLIMGVVSLVIGLFIIYRPIEFVAVMTVLFGVIIFISGIFHLFLFFRMR